MIGEETRETALGGCFQQSSKCDQYEQFHGVITVPLSCATNFLTFLFPKHSTIYNDGRSSHEVAGSARQEDQCSAKVLRLSPSHRWRSLHHKIVVFFVSDDVLRQRCFVIPRWSQSALNLAVASRQLAYPGQMQLTWMPFAASSLLKAFVICSTPPLDAAYAETLYMPKNEVIDPMLMILPGLSNSNILFANSCDVTKLDLRFTEKT